MCGICGILDYKGTLINSCGRSAIETMNAAMRHRGPDDNGIYLDKPAALGATRLSIIDLSPAAGQPMISNTGDLAIVFNGEIYNHVELRRALEKLGVTFITNSDTETLLALYARLKEDCLAELRGMFAFAIWDRTEQKMFVARDRFGEKPLVYYCDGQLFVFASEINALLKLPWIPRRIDPIGLHLGLHYTHIPAPYCAFKDIRKLPPATCLSIDSQGLHSKRYWRFRFDRPKPRRTMDEYAEMLSQSLEDSVASMSRSDVPVGAVLSGGLDSSSVVAALANNLPQFHTFRISSGIEANQQEYVSAQKVAERYHTIHHEIQFDRDALLSLKTLATIYAEPTATFTALDAYLLSAKIREYVTVALTGNGGDELFGGYPDHKMLLKFDQDLARWRQLERYGIDQLFSAGPDTRLRRWAYACRRLSSLMPGLVWPSIKFERIHQFEQTVFAPWMKGLAAENDPAALCLQVFAESGATTLFDGFMAQQLFLISQYSMVDISDAMGMTNSVEYRAPFLDVKLVELAMQIPAAFKVDPRQRSELYKLILRHAMGKKLPAETLQCRKTGFGGTNPYRRWFWEQNSEVFAQKMQSPALAETGLFDMKKLQELYLLGTCGQPVDTDMLWTVAVIAEWLEHYF